ncbi:hypothetical protein [Nonomuraea sp. NPDC005650]|uniref:hypothetical protein n=1 Tax=Nonomuraea sp. NPDC005650 TaxID=3157045 RepID=UPI0033A8D7C1
MRFGRRPYDAAADVDHLAWVNALAADDQLTSQPTALPAWRDLRNPAEQLLTPADEHDYTWIERGSAW